MTCRARSIAAIAISWRGGRAATLSPCHDFLFPCGGRSSSSRTPRSIAAMASQTNAAKRFFRFDAFGLAAPAREQAPAPPITLASARGLAIHALAHRDRRELLVGRLFLVEVGVEELDDVVVLEGFGPGD
jgi:hypothetical protein